MFEYTCYDETGNTLDCFYQWDIGRTIGIDLGNVSANDSIEVRYTNKYKSSFTVGVTADVRDGIVYASVPDEMLTEACILNIRVCVAVGNVRKTIACVGIPVRESKIPDNYYEDFIIATNEEFMQFFGL